MGVVTIADILRIAWGLARAVALLVGTLLMMGKAGLPRWYALVPLWGSWKLRQRVCSSKAKAVALTIWEVVATAVAVGVLVFGLQPHDFLGGGFDTLRGILLASFVVLMVVGAALSVTWARDVAWSFEQGSAFGILVFFLPFVAYLILGCGTACYEGPAGDPDAACDAWRRMDGMPGATGRQTWSQPQTPYMYPYPQGPQEGRGTASPKTRQVEAAPFDSAGDDGIPL